MHFYDYNYKCIIVTSNVIIKVTPTSTYLPHLTITLIIIIIENFMECVQGKQIQPKCKFVALAMHNTKVYVCRYDDGV